MSKVCLSASSTDCRYSEATGVFTVPPSGDGWYYFSAFLRGDSNEYSIFDVTLNDDVICSTVEDTSCSTGSDAGQGGCGAVVYVVEGKCSARYVARFLQITSEVLGG